MEVHVMILTGPVTTLVDRPTNSRSAFLRSEIWVANTSMRLSDVGTDDYDTSEKQRIPAWTG
jgi:hypothetical protein